jgi:LAO/AO transport system kinase
VAKGTSGLDPGRMVLYLGEPAKKVDAEKIIKGLLSKRRADLARAITLVEDNSECANDILRESFKYRGHGRIIGITGSPGVGKSTLVDSLISTIRGQGHSVGIIAVDPSSPFTGGAILGDRVRMRSRTTDDGVFFRSLASRGHLGGLSRHTGEIVTVMDAFGFDYILIETVGTGQSEVDIMRYAHSVLVVLAPGLGDDIQAIKAGILEIGDIFCVNKSDHPDADRAVSVLEAMLELNRDWKWRPPVVKTVAAQGTGIDGLFAQIKQHQEFLEANNLIDERVSRSYLASLEENIKRETVDRILKAAEFDGTLDQAMKDLLEGKSDPVVSARLLTEKYLCPKYSTEPT